MIVCRDLHKIYYANECAYKKQRYSWVQHVPHISICWLTKNIKIQCSSTGGNLSSLFFLT